MSESGIRVDVSVGAMLTLDHELQTYHTFCCRGPGPFSTAPFSLLPQTLSDYHLENK